jgi:signal recognition particle subunit SRP54
VVGRPIAFASTGEKLEDFDTFSPDRLASRILGMGDVLSLIEKAEEAFDEAEAEAATAKLLDGTFTLDDFLEQMQQVKKMGPLKGIIGMLPGVPKEVRDADIDERELGRVEAIIRSMTKKERAKPDLIDGSRRRRIAEGSGTSPSQVSALLRQFKDMQRMMRKMGAVGGGASQAKKAKKGGGGPRRKGGGRTTPKGTGSMPKVPADLPMDLPGLN